MDRIDHRIVHCLLADGRASFARIGSVLGVSPQTVARRFHALRASGAVRVVGTPSPSATGRELWFVSVLCRPGTADQVGRALIGRPEVSWISVVSGGAGVICAVEVGGSSSRDSVLLGALPHSAQVLRFDAVQVLHRFTGPGTDWSAFPDRVPQEAVEALVEDSASMRPPEADAVALTAEDAPLLDRLGVDGRASVVDLSRTIGWSAPRVRKRLEQILRTGALTIELEIDPASFSASSSAFLWITAAPGALDDVGRLIAAQPEIGFTAAITGRSNLVAAISAAGAEDLYHCLHADLGAIAAVREIEVAPVLRRMKRADRRPGHALIRAAAPRDQASPH